MKLTLEQEKKLKEARQEYKREWNRRNPDKVREHQKRYWLKQAQIKAAIREGGADGNNQGDS